MILILDTSIFISSLIKDSVTRQILLFPSMKFYLPEYALEEIETPFLALALATENDGVWSNDKDFETIKQVKVWKTQDLLKYLKKH